MGDEEVAAHLNPSGPIAAAYRWLHLALVEEDIETLWPLTAHPLRLALAQAVIMANVQSSDMRALDRLADDYSRIRPCNPQWPSMQRGLAATFKSRWSGDDQLEKWPALRPGLVDPTHELVILVHPSTPEVIEEGESFVATSFLVAAGDDGWLIAGLGETPPEPGWPPKFPNGPLLVGP